MQIIELRLMNEDTDVYSIFFQGEILGETIISSLYNPYFCIKVTEGNEKMSNLLKRIGAIFKATFYINNTPIISGTPYFNGSDFKIYDKNAEPCEEYSNREKIIINI